MLKAYVVPHPPILLPEIGRGEEAKIAKTTAAYQQVAREIADLKPDTIIISSPHSPMYADGFFIAGSEVGRGDFGRFSAPQVVEEFHYDHTLSSRICHICQEEGIPTALLAQAQVDHAVLIPIHFIHQYYRNFRLVQVGLSGLSPEDHYHFGQCIRKAVDELGRKAVYVASGDLSHVLKEDGPYGYRPEGPEFDRKIMDILSRAAFDELLSLPEDFCERAAECGLRSFEIMAGALAGDQVKAQKLSYEGPFGVGYGVLSFSLSPRETTKDSEHNQANTTITAVENSDQPNKREAVAQDYIGLARQSISYFLEHGHVMPIPTNLPESLLSTKAGCFVSLHRQHKLRGCIGTMAATRDSLASEIIHNAVSAANYDPRFPALQAQELEDLEISIDVLGELEHIASKAELDPQRYGVYVARGRRSGVLLPRLEGVDTVEEQVSIALAKSGINPRENYELYRFEVKRYEED